MTGTANQLFQCYGSCGELYQGIVDGQEILMSYHIEAKNTLQVTSTKAFSTVLPSKMRSVLRASHVASKQELIHHSQLPVGKGCASSTADLLCALQYVGWMTKQTLSPEEMTLACAKIEPSDSIAFDDWTAINPMSGQLIEAFQWRPELFVYVLEPNDILLTTNVPRLTECPLFDAAYSTKLYVELQQAITSERLDWLGDIMMTCAKLNEVRVKKPYLKTLENIVKEAQLIGLNIAHSGTVVGLVMTAEQAQNIQDIEKRLSFEPLAHYYKKRTLYRIVYKGVSLSYDIDSSHY